MSEPTAAIQTEAGPLTVRPLERDTLEQLGTLFPKVGWIEDQGRRLLALLPISGSHVLQGLRTAYGYYAPDQRQEAEKVLLLEQLLIVDAVAQFRARGFQGVLMPGACIAGAVSEHSQVGELLFLRARGPLRRGPSPGKPIYEKHFGEGATDILLSFVVDACGAWNKLTQLGRAVTDLEPIPVDYEKLLWRADIVLVDDRVVVIRPELTPDDWLLKNLVLAGICEVEHTPSVLLLQPSEGADGTRS